MASSRGWIAVGCAGGSVGWALACTGAGEGEAPITVPDPVPVEQPAVDEDPSHYTGKWFYEKVIADGCATGVWENQLQIGGTEFRGAQLVDTSAGNPDQVLDILSSEKRGDDWILKVRIGDWQGERFVRWTRFGEEMVYGVPDDGGLPYYRIDLSAEEVERAFLAGRKCGAGGGAGGGGGERTKSKGKAGKHKGG